MRGNLSYHDKFGQYSMWIESKILFCIVHGAIGETVAKHFHLHFCQLADNLAPNPWAYCADLSACEGYTPEAANRVKASHQYGISRGCIVDAYQISSPLLINQSQKFREALGLDTHINDRIFSNDKSCIAFLTAELSRTRDHI
ncbi:MAG: hypothetical protein NWQ26_02185 [Paraglaciecola sp.]|nr:hypothetical protein [Paraglaciecola sp.]